MNKLTVNIKKKTLNGASNQIMSPNLIKSDL